MTQLEHQLGFPLFERIGRKTRMTPPARERRRRSSPALRPVDELVARLRGDHVEIGRGAHRWAAAVFAAVAAAAAHELKKGYPEILPEVQFDMAWVLSPRLVAGEIDLCILVGPVEADLGLDSQRIYTEEFVAIASPGYLKAHGVPRRLEEFSQRQFIVYDEGLVMLRPWWRPSSAGARRCRAITPAASPTSTRCWPSPRRAWGYGAAQLLRRGVGGQPRHGRAGARAAQQKDAAPLALPHHLAWRKSAIDTARLKVVRQWLLK